MKKSPFILFFISCLFIQLSAQERFKEFKLKQSNLIISNSLYNKIRMIDQRQDTSKIGVVQLGMLNKPNTLICKPSLSAQLNEFLHTATDSTAKPGELVLHLKKLDFSERTAAFTEEGFCAFVADLYEKMDSDYLFVSSIDTLFRCTGADVTRRLINTGDTIISRFIQENLTRAGNQNNTLSYIDIIYADSIAKRKIKIYNTTTFTNGLYLTYESFKNQIPDHEAIVERKKEKIKSVRIKDSNGLTPLVNPAKVYGLVNDGQPFIATGYGFYPLRFENDNFSFIGKFKAPAKSGAVMPAMLMFGIMGAAIAAETGSKSYFETIINYKNGNFIKIRELPFGVDTTHQ